MAPYSFDLLDQEQKKKQQEGQDDGMGAPAMTGGGSTFGSGQPTQSQPGSEKGTNQQGSGFVGLDKYMTANKGSGFGNQFTGKVQGTVEAGKNALNQGAEGFTQASNQGTTRWNDVGDTVKGIVDNAGDNTAQDQVSQYQGYANAKYQGPQNFLGSAYGTQAQSAVNKASQEANAFQTEGGRFALLDQYYGRPKYNSGEKALDNLLVQNTPGVQARAQSIGNQSKQLAASGVQKTQDLDNLATSNAAATQDTAKQTRDYLGNAVTGFQSDLQKRYQDYTAGNDAYNQARRSDLSDDALDEETLNLLGLSEGSNLYDLNLSNYLQENPQGTVGEFASDQDYARYLALQQLAGEDPTLLSSEDRANAGKATGKGRLSADKDRIVSDAAARKSTYDSGIAEYDSQIQAAQSRINMLNQFLSSISPNKDPNNVYVIDDGNQQDGGSAAAELAALTSRIAQLNNAKNALASTYKVNRKASRA